MLLVHQCPICGRATRRICAKCWDLLPGAGKFELDGVNWCMALFAYTTDVRSLILQTKNHGRTDLVAELGRRMADAVKHHGGVGSASEASIDVVTWVPAAGEHRKFRGFDQGQLLARAVGSTLKLPVRRMFHRTGRAQTGHNRHDRLGGPTIRASRTFSGRVLVVDDVVTTGRSLERAADVLHQSGVETVDAIAVARVDIEHTYSTNNSYTTPKGASHGGHGKWS